MYDFCEYIVKRKRDAKDIIIAVLAVLGAIFLNLLIIGYVFNFPAFISFIPLFCAIVWYGAYRLIKLKSIEFEYALTSGELDVDKIIDRKKRKRLLSIHSRSILDMAPVSSGKYTDSYKQLVTVDASSNRASENKYFAVFEKDGQSKCLIFEPSAKMLEMMHHYNPNKISL